MENTELQDDEVKKILQDAEKQNVISDEIQESLSDATDAVDDEDLPYTEPEPDGITHSETETGNPDLMSMEFVPPDLVMTLLAVFIPVVAVLIYQKIYGKKAIDKKVVKREYSFTMKEERQIEEKLELWLKSMQVKAPSPFVQLLIVLVVIMAGKAVAGHGEIIESIESKEEENKLLQQIELEKQKNKLVVLNQKLEVEKGKTINLSTEQPKKKGRPAGSTKKPKAEPKQEIELPQDEEPREQQDDLITE